MGQTLLNGFLPALSIPGFGDYALPDGKTFEQMQSAQKLQKIAYAILFGILSLCSFLLLPFSAPIAVCSAVGFSFFSIAKILGAIGNANRAPPMNDLFPTEVMAELPQIGQVSSIPCRGFPTKNGPDSYNWKHELIKAARHSIVLSGCYCGDDVFDETLDLMTQQMRLFPELKINILSSDSLITKENLTHVDRLKEEFQDRFCCIVTPELFPMVSPHTEQLSITSNHCKILVIDAGAYFMLGGTGITHSFSEEMGLVTPAAVDDKTSFIENVMDSVLKLKAFRDMDFVFHSPINGIGTRLHVEMMKLFERMRFRQDGTVVKPDTNWLKEVEPTSQLFEEMETRCDGLAAACFVSGPEQEENAYLEELVRQVDEAAETIAIAHLYFHPPQKLLQALIRAARRQVKITVLMNKDWAKSPGSHALYAHRSRYFASQLYEGELRENIELLEFSVPFTSLHKKLIVIDRWRTFFGSANLGKKSLENLDYEVNLMVESAPFAEEVLATIEKDKQCCKLIPLEESANVSIMTKVLAPIQALPMFIV